MHLKQLFTFLFLFFSSYFVSQTDALNNFNPAGKKNGYWIQYLDETVLPTDSTNSYFYGYEFYDNGEKVFIYYKDWFKTKTKPKYSGILPKKGQPLLITGTFKWYDQKDSALYTEEIYSNGHPVIFRTYSRNRIDNSIYTSELLDFTKKFNNTTGSYYIEMDAFSGRKRFYFRKGKKHWRAFRIRD